MPRHPFSQNDPVSTAFGAAWWLYDFSPPRGRSLLMQGYALRFDRQRLIPVGRPVSAIRIGQRPFKIRSNDNRKPRSTQTQKD